LALKVSLYDFQRIPRVRYLGDDATLCRTASGVWSKNSNGIEMAQLAVSSILFKSLSLKLPEHLQSFFHDSVNAIRKGVWSKISNGLKIA
jgi:hypothetical protein